MACCTRLLTEGATCKHMTCVDSPTAQQRRQAGSYRPLAGAFLSAAKESFSMQVRFSTRRPGVESGSTQK